MARFPHVEDCGASSAENKARTDDIVRAMPLVLGRARAAATFDDVLRARTARKDYGASNCAIGDRLAVAEKQIREYRTGDKALPFGAVFALPTTIALDLLNAARALISAPPSVPRSPESQVRRLSAIVGELNSLVDDDAPTADRRNALRLAASRLVAEADSLIAHLSQET